MYYFLSAVMFLFQQKAFLKFIIICYVQALAAASKTVDCLKLVHSLHGYFLLAADLTS